MVKEIEQLRNIYNEFVRFQHSSVPLCAAENVLSDFVKEPLAKDFQERYIMGSAYEYSMEDNFIGSEYLLPYYKMISSLGREIFHAKYTDARTLTGMNAANILISVLAKPNDNIMILSKDWGGHASMRPTFERLGANIYDAPYIHENYDFDYDRLNQEIDNNNIKFLNIAPSDILFPLDLEKINDDNCTVLLDYSQVLGLVAAGLWKNPLDSLKNCVLYGGTHKTMPGPAHGIIMTNNDKIYAALDKGINPKFLRNTQTHQVISLLHCLIEMKYYGREYQYNTIKTANFLGKELQNRGINVVCKNGIFTKSHQLFMEMSEEDMYTMFRNALTYAITLNTKKKPLFKGGYGIRLGLQEISRYNWDNKAISTIADILSAISKKDYPERIIYRMIGSLPIKKIHYTF